MSNFDIMLNQCELQAEKLCLIEIDEKYFNEVDIFTNYFFQLQQIIENEGKDKAKNRVRKLSELMDIFIKRIEEEKKSIKTEIGNVNRNKNMVGYGAVKYQTSHRINRVY